MLSPVAGRLGEVDASMGGCGCCDSAIPRQSTFDHADQIELPFRSSLLEHLLEILACAALGDVKVVRTVFHTLVVEHKCRQSSLSRTERNNSLNLAVVALAGM